MSRSGRWWGSARRRSWPAILAPTRVSTGTRWCSSSTPSPSRCRSVPLLVVNLNDRHETGPFRTLPRQVQAIENNLSLGNMDFVEFARAAGPDGVFRGF
ncbi:MULTISPECIES: DUF6924 domain-containing protein [unclassified Micromonospora]|uniref:DUF6924 domain-containing protein n=1 Tax=unclassified Micromonospora TaxID=2617518 RepID=UPI0036367587